MFASDEQLARVCSALLARVGLSRLWTAEGPTDEAQELLEQDGGPLSGGERVVVLLAWALWNGAGKLTVAETVARLDENHLAAFGGLLQSMSRGSGGIDEWLAAQLGKKAAAPPASVVAPRRLPGG